MQRLKRCSLEVREDLKTTGDMSEIIVYGCLCNLENIPRPGDLSFMNTKDLLYLTTVLGGSLDAGIPFSFFPEKKANGSISGP